MEDKELSGLLVIFGGTGDLTHRKLMPAIYNLALGKLLPENFAVVSVGRREYTNETYRNEIFESVKEFSREKTDNEEWEKVKDRIFYYKMDFDSDEGYSGLKGYLNGLDEKYNTKGNRLFYLAVAPEYFGAIVDKVNIHGMVDNANSWQRVMIEKPFGENLETAQSLNKKLTDVFSEKNIYRIDHYLGKEMLQNLMVIRFANALFEPIWNNLYIDNIQISSSETVGVETRGGYYDKAGALRDMVQNHMLQLLTLTAMEPPISLDTQSIRDEKVKVLKTLQPFTHETVGTNIVRGQYISGMVGNSLVAGYRQEEKVSPKSSTETFVALKVYVDNFRWAGVPFYIRTGKRMAKKSTEIIIQFKPSPKILYFKEYKDLMPNILVIKIQPEEGTYLQFNAKRPGTIDRIMPVQMDFCQNCQIGENSPEAYERLIYDALRGDSTLFARWDEVEYSWRFVDTIVESFKDDRESLNFYEPGTYGPKESVQLLKNEDRQWWNMEELNR